MIKGKTSSGFEYEISKNTLNDFRLVRLLGKSEENPLKIVEVVDRVLGEDQAEELEKHLENEDGTVPTDKMTQEIIEIFKNSGEETKNS